MTFPNRQRPWLLAAASAALLAGAAGHAGAAVSLSGDLNAVANASMNGKPAATDSASQSFTGAPQTLNTSVNATVTARGFNADHTDYVSSFGTAQATWASANSGAVDFTNYGWDFSVNNQANTPSAADVDFDRPGSGNDWTYTFTATGNGEFVMDYDVVGTGTVDGLQGWNINFSGPGGGLLLTGVLPIPDPTQSGVFTRALVAGQTYTVSLDGNPNIEDGNFSANFAGSMNGTFDWSIRDGVPEPTCWALMLTGFFGMGALLRARRRTALAA
ncbi:MAG TPA: PEP-CTERM sorting domain-containing protein [Phenylobacterium sp.]|jgi:hypothetical protein|uniref:PEP-CTERM sorting domain-containing protein n=1 Tax=Phenylobacterium sp. TaxID=1871053 RepID=UPI002D6BE227|nr:PEP-CTERM sorting domain-containing protein [Phenylobacterium sp.]HZZ66745.1 PEP-CTERM sorting domain-containing protein [Phenylobacterium sp.]